MMIHPKLQELIEAAKDPEVQKRYFAKIHKTETCWLWTGAISGKGHGRFWVHDALVVVAHRFAWLIHHIDLGLPENVLHSCDNPICQNPQHLQAGTWSQNRIDYLNRRLSPGSPLRDIRGARGRAEALRNAAVKGISFEETIGAGLSEIDRHQKPLW